MELLFFGNRFIQIAGSAIQKKHTERNQIIGLARLTN
jgi:hypothetical protein